jgi:hypothetical protein
MKIFSLFLILVVSINLRATVFEYTWRNSVSNSSNITQRPSGDAGNIYSSGLLFFAESESVQNWEFRLNGDLSHVWYSVPNLLDEDRHSLATFANYTSDQSNFSLNLLADIRQAPNNRFQTQEVNNLRDTMLYAVSPRYFFTITDATRLTIGYQHADYGVETDSTIETLQNTPRLEQQLSVSLDTILNPSNRFSIVAQKKDTDFDTSSADVAVDFLQYDIFARWIISQRANQILTEGGQVRVKSFTGQSAKESQWRLMLTRQINRNQTLNIQYSKSVASLFTINQATGNITINQQNDAITSAQISKGGGLQYNFSNNLTSITLGLIENELYGLFEPTFEIRRSKSIRATYSLSRLFNTPLPRQIIFFASSNENDFELSITNTQESVIKVSTFIYSENISSNLLWFFDYSKRSAKRFLINLPSESTNSETFSIGFEYRYDGRF